MKMAAFLLFIVVSPVGAADLTVYTYDSFAGKDTLGAEMAARSQAATGCKTVYKVFPSAGEALNQVALEGKTSRADVVVGVDQTLLGRAAEIGGFEKLSALKTYGIDEALKGDADGRWVPFDYGYLALVYDDRRKDPPPAGISLRDFARDPRFRKRLVLEDPRTSSLGRSLLVWSRMLFLPKEDRAFWKDLLQQSFTLTPGWSAAYGLFLNREADFVFSYTTSPAYHIEKEKQNHIRALVFPEGNYRQVEMVGVRSAAPNKACAIKWVELLLSAPVQTALPLQQWMYPARKATPLPKSFESLPAVKKVLDEPAIARSVGRDALRAWTALANEKP